MGLFNMFSKKKPAEAPAQQHSLELPPPPAPDMAMPASDVRIVNELPDIEEVEAPGEVPEPAHKETLEAPEPVAAEPAEAPHEAEMPAAIQRAARVEPMFVSVNDYQDVLGHISYIRNKLGEADELVKKLNAIKQAEEKQFQAWMNGLEDVHRKVAYVEDVISAAG